MRKLFLCLVLSFASLGAQDQSKTDKAEAYMQAAAKTWGFSGTVLVSEKGEPFYANGFGKSSFQLNIPNDSRNIFKIGEITQIFTSAAIMQQVQKGLIELANPIGKYLSDLPREWSDKVTIQQLLSNTSGLPNLDTSSLRGRELTYADFANYMNGKSLKFEPGTNFDESNSNYILLGMLLSEMTGISFEGYVQQRFTDPLAMKSTAYYHPEWVVPLMSYGYSLDSRYHLINAPCASMAQVNASNGLFSSMSDLFVFTQALLSDKVIGPYMKKLTFATNKNNFGFGWHVDSDKTKTAELKLNNFGKLHYWQQGEVDGYSALLSVYPDDNVVIIILSNNDRNFFSSRIFYPMHDALGGIVFDKPYPPPVESVMTTPR